MTAYMTKCMAGHDPSHNPIHVHRVVKLAHEILARERSRGTNGVVYDDTIITLSAILHDIGDRKYLPTAIASITPGTATNSGSTESIDPNKMVHDVLIAHGAAHTLAERVQTIVSNVSYSNEVKNPARVHELVDQEGYRELAIVQDADRLDALGAVGIGRCFVYLGSQGDKRRNQITAGNSGTIEYPRWRMDEAIEHFTDKLERLESMMKTETGREMARIRTQRLQDFKKWWEEETEYTA